MPRLGLPRTIEPLLRGLAALVLVLAAPATAGAQEADEGAPGFASPRAAMRAFLDQMVAYRQHGLARHLDHAVEAFQGESWPREELERRVETLYRALNRVEYVDYARVPGPDAPELSDGRAAVVFGPPASAPEATVGIDFERGEGGWLIADRTLARVDDVWSRVSDLPLIEDLPLLARTHAHLRAAMPEALLARVFVLENWQWLGLLVLALAAIVLDRVARIVAGIVVRRLARGQRIDADSVEGFGRPIGLLAAAVAFGFALPMLDLEPQILGFLDLAAAFVAAVAGVWATYRLVDVFSGYLESRAAATRTRFDDVLVPLLRRTLKLFVAILGAVFLASRFTDDLWGVVAGLGVGSIAVAFAARDTIENLFGTFTVLLDKPFELGDWILVGDIEGSVEEVGFRSTRIRTFYNSLITVPNRMFVTSEVDNMGRRRYRRVKSTLALTYDTPPEKIEAFCAGVRRIVAEHPYTRKDSFHVYLDAFGSHSLDVLLYAFLECPDWGTELREKHRLFADVLRLAERLDVAFAFPTQTLHVTRPEDVEDAEEADRPPSEDDAARRGEEAAAAVVAASLAPFGGAKPPPVASPADPHARRGSDDGG